MRVSTLLLLGFEIYLLYHARRLPRGHHSRRLPVATAVLLIAATLSHPFPRLDHAFLGAAAFALLFLSLTLFFPHPRPISPLTRQIRNRVAAITLFLGTLSSLLSFPAGAPEAGLAIGLLLALAARRAPIGGENEITYPEVHRTLLRAGMSLLALLAPAAYAPSDLHPFLSLLAASLLLAVAAAAGAAFAYRGGTREIRLFLGLLIPGLAIGGASAFLPRTLFAGAGLLLISRIFLALAALFILRQYTRWGFVAVRTTIILLVLFSATGLVSFFSYLLSPVAFEPFPGERAVLLGAIGALEIVLLLALPAVVIHYERGTMRVTWTLLTLGLYWEAVLPATRLASPGEPLPPDAVFLLLLAYALIALALFVSTRYLGLLRRALTQAIAAADQVTKK